ncbi:RNA polymerase I [Cystobasidium minutum MCA 4210]|uniref:RNA polymerase I n=1 Tax=Cystobasidium minutum MCA 4210 TaxID=1397322 RepID=UPI0034CDE65D|eukprot:jgi/Rhomi1/72193/CE72192_573
MASSSSNILFDDLFKVSAVDRDGKKFDRVSRINAKSENHEMDLTLDINTDLWPLVPNDTFSFVLANSLTTSDSSGDGMNGVNEGDGETAAPSWRLDTGKSMGLADEYEYVMYGKVYKFDGAAAERVTAYASFGGLLMALTGAYRHVSNITVGDNIYLLARK